MVARLSCPNRAWISEALAPTSSIARAKVCRSACTLLVPNRFRQVSAMDGMPRTCPILRLHAKLTQTAASGDTPSFNSTSRRHITHPCQFAEPPPCLEADDEQGVIARADERRAIDRGKPRFDLEVGERGRVGMPLHRSPVYAGDRVAAMGHP